MARPIRYKSLNATQNWRLRGTYQQTDKGMLALNPTNVITNPESGQNKDRALGVAFGFVQLTVRAVGPYFAGIGGRVPNRLWTAGTWTDATTTFTDKTSILQGTATAQALETATASDGFAVFSSTIFNAVTVNVTAAETGLAPVWDFAYSGPTGWTNFPTSAMTITDFAGTLIVAGEAMAVWDPPADWVTVGNQSSGSFGTNAPAGMYGVRFRATTPAGTNKLSVTGMEVALIGIQSAGPTGGLTAAAASATNTNASASATYSPVLSSAETQLLWVDGIVAVFSAAGVQPASVYGHSVDASYRTSAAS